MATNDQTEILGREEGTWVWCLHCERCYQVGEYRSKKKSDIQLCPYPDCEGDTVMDSWTWENIRETHPEYPEVPEKGKVYPLYS